MAQQAASEFDQLKAELCQEKQRNKSLQVTLCKKDNESNKFYSLDCKKCKALISEMDYLKKEKQRALTIAKFAYQKLNQSVKEYQKQLSCEKQQHRYMTLIIKKKENEIGCLKNQIYQSSSKSVKKMSSYIL